MSDDPSALDPISLTQELIRCASVTPLDEGALDVVQSAAERLGFTVHRLDFDGTPNLFARRGDSGPHLCFAGHTDVVPAGDVGWMLDPFGAEIIDGVIHGRGASDMKGTIAAFLAAVSRLPSSEISNPTSSISLLITGDEEGPATNGTVRVLEWMANNGHIPDFCIVGEASNPSAIGEMVKNGRRGSLNASIVVHGTQGHVAYPEQADNPLHRLLAALTEIIATPLDEGSDSFEPSTLQVTTVDVGNRATNVIPASAAAHLNIRYNDLHSAASLENHLRSVLDRHCPAYDLDAVSSGDAFVTTDSAGLAALVSAIESVTGITPVLSTTGGTSDARFITKYCPVAEFGLTNGSIHHVNESARVDDVHLVSRVYEEVLVRFQSA
jgi:succinyl-diaminopimelate desuccinylase